MKSATDRPFADPAKAARKLLEIGNSLEPYAVNRPLVESLNRPSRRKVAARPNTAPASNTAIAKWLTLAAYVRDLFQVHPVRRGSVRLVPWSRPFADPIPLPDGRQLITLCDVGEYFHSLPRNEQRLEEWQAATEALIMAAENRGRLMHARIGVQRALNRNGPRAFNPDRKDTHWGKRKLARRHMRTGWTFLQGDRRRKENEQPPFALDIYDRS